jgi:hypothetical protein
MDWTARVQFLVSEDTTGFENLLITRSFSDTLYHSWYIFFYMEKIHSNETTCKFITWKTFFNINEICKTSLDFLDALKF